MNRNVFFIGLSFRFYNSVFFLRLLVTKTNYCEFIIFKNKNSPGSTDNFVPCNLWNNAVATAFVFAYFINTISDSQLSEKLFHFIKFGHWIILSVFQFRFPQ